MAPHLELCRDGTAKGRHHRHPLLLLLTSVVSLAGLVAAPLAAVRFVDGRLLQVPAVLFSVAVCVHVFLDAATELRERGVVAKAERNLWLLVERDIYASAQLVALRPGRTVCVLHLPASDPAAPVLFLVHGSMARLSQFKHQIQFFTDKGFTVVAYDYFGMGRSHKPRHADYSTHSHMEDLKALYRRYRSAVAPNFVAGHSFGSAQTLRLASSAATDTSLHPSPAGIMLLGGGKLDPEKRTKALQLFKLPVWALRVLHPMLSKGFKSRALHPNTLTSQESHHVELMTVAAAANGANPFHVTAPFYRSTMAADARTLQPATTRCVFISGEADKILPPAAAEALRDDAMPHADVHVVPLASHQVMQEAPREVNGIMLQFMTLGTDS